MNQTATKDTRTSVFYTSILGEVEGFQVAATSDPLSKVEQFAIELHSAARSRDLELNGPAVRFYPAGDRWALTRVVAAGTDYTGREGNVLAHTILLEKRDVHDPRFSASSLLAAGLFADELPSSDSPARVALPEPSSPPGWDPRSFEQLEHAFGPELRAALAWLASGKRVALRQPKRKPLGLEPLEFVRNLLVGPAREAFSFSTSNDNPRLQRYALSVVPRRISKTASATWSKLDRELAVFDTESQTWLVPPRVDVLPEALNYADYVLTLARTPALSDEQRPQFLNTFFDWLSVFAEAKGSDPFAADVVDDAGELTLLDAGCLSLERPQRKALRCLFPYAHFARAREETKRRLPQIAAEAFRHCDLNLLLGTYGVLLRSEEEKAQAKAAVDLALRIEKGAGLASHHVGPLVFELQDRAKAVGLPPVLGERLLAFVGARATRTRWSFSSTALSSFARFGGQGSVQRRLIANRILENLLAQAASEPELLAAAREAFSPQIEAWIPDTLLPVDRLVELFTRCAEDLRLDCSQDLARLVVRLAEKGGVDSLRVNAQRLLAGGLPPAIFVRACLRLAAVGVLVRNASRLPPHDTEALACGTWVALRQTRDPRWLEQWLAKLPYPSLPAVIAGLEAARRELAADLGHRGRWEQPLSKRERERLLAATERRLHKATPREVDPNATRALVLALRPHVGWKALVWSRRTPALRRCARRLVVYPRLRRAAWFALFAFSTACAALLCQRFALAVVLPTDDPWVRDASLPLVALFLLLAARAEEELHPAKRSTQGERQTAIRLRLATVFRPLALVLLALWGVLFSGLVPLLFPSLAPETARPTAGLLPLRIGKGHPLAPVSARAFLALAIAFGGWWLEGRTHPDRAKSAPRHYAAWLATAFLVLFVLILVLSGPPPVGAGR